MTHSRGAPAPWATPGSTAPRKRAEPRCATSAWTRSSGLALAIGRPRKVVTARPSSEASWSRTCPESCDGLPCRVLGAEELLADVLRKGRRDALKEPVPRHVVVDPKKCPDH